MRDNSSMKSPLQRQPVFTWVRSLRSKILLSHLAVIFIAAIITGFSLLSLAESYFLNALESSLISQAHVITQSLLPQLHTANRTSIQCDSTTGHRQSQRSGHRSLRPARKRGCITPLECRIEQPTRYYYRTQLHN